MLTNSSMSFSGPKYSVCLQSPDAISVMWLRTLVLRFPPVNQWAVRSQYHRNFPAQRNMLVRSRVEPLKTENSNSSKEFPKTPRPRIGSSGIDDGCRRTNPDSLLRIAGTDRRRFSHGYETHTAKTRVLGLVEIKSKDRSRVNSVWVRAISVIRETPIIGPIILLQITTFVVSPKMVRPVLGRGWDGKNIQADGERA